MMIDYFNKAKFLISEKEKLPKSEIKIMWSLHYSYLISSPVYFLFFFQIFHDLNIKA